MFDLTVFKLHFWRLPAMPTPKMKCDEDPLGYMGRQRIFQELEEIPMTSVGGLDVHQQQITFDYVDDDGLVHW